MGLFEHVLMLFIDTWYPYAYFAGMFALGFVLEKTGDLKKDSNFLFWTGVLPVILLFVVGWIVSMIGAMMNPDGY